MEAETFTPSSVGWKTNKKSQVRGASSVTALSGATGDARATAETLVKIPQAGDYRVWVRHNYYRLRRGPFRLSVTQNGQLAGEQVFDLNARPSVRDWQYVWDSFDVALSAG